MPMLGTFLTSYFLWGHQLTSPSFNSLKSFLPYLLRTREECFLYPPPLPPLISIHENCYHVNNSFRLRFRIRTSLHIRFFIVPTFPLYTLIPSNLFAFLSPHYADHLSPHLKLQYFSASECTRRVFPSYHATWGLYRVGRLVWNWVGLTLI